jgi:hypothetical protein
VSDQAIDKAPFRPGETWTITAVSPDGKTTRTLSVEMTGTASYDAEDTEVYIDAKLGTLKALTYYDPDTEQQAVEVFMDSNRDPQVTWCDFDEIRRGVTQSTGGLSFMGLRSRLGAALDANGPWGKCSLRRTK